MSKRIVKFKHSGSGFVAMMKSDGVRADLQRRADAIKDAAEPGFKAHTHPKQEVRVIADTHDGADRVTATVLVDHPAALRVEAEHRILGSAIDAAAD